MTPDLVLIVLRALGFVALFQAMGIALFLGVLDGHLEKSLRSVRRLGLVAAVLGSVLVVAQHVLEPARMVGSFAGVFDVALHLLLLGSDAGAANALRLLGLTMVAFGVLRRSRFGATVGISGATLVAVSFAFVGHTATHDQRWLLSVLLTLHLLIVAFWFGALLPFYWACRRESVAKVAALVEEFSLIAVWLVPGIFVAGLGMAVMLMSDLANLWSPYGAALLGKVLGFVLLMGLAILNKWRYTPAIAAGETSAVRAFRRSVAIEWGLIAGVLIISAVMTVLFSPVV